MSERVVIVILAIMGVCVFFGQFLLMFAPRWEWILAGVAAAALVLYFGAMHVVSKKYRPLTFKPFEPESLMRGTRRLLDEMADEIETLGFRSLGNFQLDGGFELVRARFFLNPDGTTFAETAVEDSMSYSRPFKAYAFFSILSDGTCVKSICSKSKHLGGSDVAEAIQLNLIPGASITDLHASHRTEVLKEAAARRAEILSFEPESLRDVAEYVHRLTHWKLYRKANRSASAPPIAGTPAIEFAATGQDPPFDAAVLPQSDPCEV